MAYIIFITAQGSDQVAFGPVKHLEAANRLCKKLVAANEGFMGTVQYLNPISVTYVAKSDVRLEVDCA